jgi:hypothetical protein
MSTEDSRTFELPNELLAAIGRVAVEWSLFEFAVNNQIGEFTNDFPAAICLTSQISTMGRRFDGLIALARLCGVGEDVIRELNVFSEKTHTMSRKRNRVLHDVWMMEDDTSHRLEITAEKRLIDELKAISVDDVIKIANEIADHDRKFLALQGRIKVSLESSPYIRRQASPPPDRPPPGR